MFSSLTLDLYFDKQHEHKIFLDGLTTDQMKNNFEVSHHFKYYFFNF
jgi:hypothetical protein